MEKIKKTAIIGRGGIGIIFGGIISDKCGKENCCFVADGDRKKRYESKELIRNGKVCDYRYESNADSFGKADLIIFSVKYPALSEAIELARPFVKEDTILISTLNGITSEDDLAKAFGQEKVIRCIAQKMDAVYTGDTATFSKYGELVIGTENVNGAKNMKLLMEFFDETGVPYVSSKDIIHDQWSKLMLNCGVNQVCAAYNVPYGGVQEKGELRQIMVDTMKEVQQIAQKEGITITDDEIEAWLYAVDQLSKDAMPSMRQDVLAGRQTEVELFSGTIKRLAEKYGLQVPVNERLYDMIKKEG